MENALPAIPAKRYFTIGEVSVLCGVKPYVLRYWEHEFTQLKPVKRPARQLRPAQPRGLANTHRPDGCARR